MNSYIICLSKIETSYTSALQVQSDLLNVGITAELFEGSYGNVAKENYLKEGKKKHPWSFKGPDKPFGENFRGLENIMPGEIGCFDSHYRLWELCVKLNEPILIFEDDVIITRPWRDVEWVDVLSVAFSHAKKTLKYIEYLDYPSGDFRAVHYGQASAPGLGGYAIKPHAAKKLVDTYKYTWLPADNAINQHVVKIQLLSHMMGRARSKYEGNISTIRTKIWDS